MRMIEEKGDLFEVSNEKEYNGYMLVHCISADFGMGAGIVVQFNKRYKMKQRLMNNYTIDGKVPQCIRVDNVYNLITKKKYWHKPTYDTLKGSLELMKEDMLRTGVTKLAMPLIGCGIDRLQWGKVKEIIEELFDEMDIEIQVRELD